ncbi:MAG: dimethylargininase [Gemmatimonadota bacterium]|nr:MAG: dimethylargininase [Gemmatimonadota bacterium]
MRRNRAGAQISDGVRNGNFKIGKTLFIALTHIVSPNISQCEVTYRNREPIDYDRAVKQHEAYCQLLRDCGLDVIELSVNRDYPDSTFLEDTAVVVDEIAIMANLGVASRRGEVNGVEQELAKYRKIRRIEPPATLDGGDVLKIGRDIFVGLSPRTNEAGIQSLKRFLAPFGYKIIPVILKDCLHLKSACTTLDKKALLVNASWLDLEPFSNFRIIQVPEDESEAANALRVNDTIFMHSGFSKTVQIARAEGFAVKTTDISELLKAEAGMTCSSIIFEHLD